MTLIDATLEPARETASVTLNETKTLAEAFDGFPLATTEDYALAGETLVDVSERLKALEERRTTITKPLNEALKAVNALFAEPKAALEGLRGRIKSSMAAFIAIQDQAETKALEAGDHVALARVAEIPKVAGVQVRESWDFEVEDEAALRAAHPELFVLNESALRALVKASKGKVQYPGVKQYKKSTLAA